MATVCLSDAVYFALGWFVRLSVAHNVAGTSRLIDQGGGLWRAKRALGFEVSQRLQLPLVSMSYGHRS
nr:hypothetical protein [Acetobacter orientalis]